MSTQINITTKDELFKPKSLPPVRVSHHVLYARVKDISALIDPEYQDNREFFEVNLDDSCPKDYTMSLVNVAGVRYHMSLRRVVDNTYVIENTTDINDYFYHAARKVADFGFQYRYLQYPHLNTGAFWEISVFLNQAGQECPWVRIELADKDPLDITKLPFEVEEYVVQDHTLDETGQSFIDQLWSQVYQPVDLSGVVKL